MRNCPFCGFNEGWIKNYEDGFRVECNVCGSAGPKSQTDEGAERKWDGYLKLKDPNDKEIWNNALEEKLGDILKPKTEKEIDSFENQYLWFESVFNVIMEETEFNENEVEILMNLADDELCDLFTKRVMPILAASVVTGNVEYLEELNMIILSDENANIDEDMGGVSAPMATLVNTPGTGSAVPASMAAMTGSQQSSLSAIGSGDKWGNSMGPYTQDGKTKKKKKKKRKVYKKKKKTNESCLNPFDKIGISMAKKLKVPLYFEQGKDQSIKHVKQKQVDNVPHKYKHKVSSYSDYANLVKNNKKFKT